MAPAIANEQALTRAMRDFAHRLNRRVLKSERRPAPTPLGRQDPWSVRIGPAISTQLSLRPATFVPIA